MLLEGHPEHHYPLNIDSPAGTGRKVGAQTSRGVNMSQQLAEKVPVKEQVRRLADQLSEHATWDDVMYQIYVRRKLATSEEAAREGRILEHEDVKRRLLGR